MIPQYNEHIPGPQGLYDPSEERDACGVGLVAALDGRPNRDVVLRGIEALKAIWHRGAVDADGKTGDGAGINLELPQAFFKEHVKATGHEPTDSKLAIGMAFLPRFTSPWKFGLSAPRQRWRESSRRRQEKPPFSLRIKL